MNFITKLVTTAFILPMTIAPAPAEAFVVFGQWGGGGKATYDASTPQEFCMAAKNDAIQSVVERTGVSLIKSFEPQANGTYRIPEAQSFGGEIKGSCYMTVMFQGDQGVERGTITYQVERFDGQDYMAHPAPFFGTSR